MEDLERKNILAQDGEKNEVIGGTELIMQNLQVLGHDEICGALKDSNKDSNLPSSTAIMGGHPETDPYKTRRLPIVETTILGSELEDLDNKLLYPAQKGQTGPVNKVMSIEMLKNSVIHICDENENYGLNFERAPTNNEKNEMIFAIRKIERKIGRAHV